VTEPEAPAESRPAQGGGTVTALFKALGAMLGVHIQYAQREAADDFGRVAGAVALFVVAALIMLVGLLVAHAAAVFAVREALGASLTRAALYVAGGDLAVVMLLVLAGRARLKRPILAQTRTLVRRTVTSFVEM
jgi:uncharacterized membrane protein